MSSRRLIVGLGNPGDRYQGTRHNLGFDVVSRLVANLAAEPIGGGELCRSRVWHQNELVLAQPLTFMNRSGLAVRCLADEYGIPAERTLVVYDEVALNLGSLRLRPGGRAAGHRGLDSVIYNLQTSEVPRLRLGIGQPVDQDLADYVLGPFEADDAEVVGDLVRRAAEACVQWALGDMQAAMNQVNQTH